MTHKKGMDSASLDKAMGYFKEIIKLGPAEFKTLMQQDPARWLEELQTILRPLVEPIQALEDRAELKLRRRTYDALAALVAPELRLEERAVAAWIVREVESSEQLTADETALARTIDGAMRARDLVLRCTYSKVDRSSYLRSIKAFVRLENGRIKTLERELPVGMDELPYEVHHAFSFKGESTHEYAIL